MDGVCGKVFRTKSPSNSLEAQASSGDIFPWELGDIEVLDVVLEGIACFLIADHHTFDDATKGSYRTTLMLGDTDYIRFNLRTKCLVH